MIDLVAARTVFGLMFGILGLTIFVTIYFEFVLGGFFFNEISILYAICLPPFVANLSTFVLAKLRASSRAVEFSFFVVGCVMLPVLYGVVISCTIALAGHNIAFTDFDMLVSMIGTLEVIFGGCLAIVALRLQD